MTCTLPFRDRDWVKCTNSLLRSAGCSDWAMLSAVAAGLRLKLAATFSPIVKPSLLWTEDELASLLEQLYSTRSDLSPTLLLNMLLEQEKVCRFMSHAHSK